MSQILVLDVSQFQPATIDFKKYADAGVRGVYVQATRGNDGSNPYFEQQVKGAIDQGLAVGAYHFCYPLPTAPGHLNRDPRGQATLFKDKALEIISGAPLKMPPMADVEWPLYGDWSKWVVTADLIGDWVPEFVKCVDEDWGKTCGVYTFRGTSTRSPGPTPRTCPDGTSGWPRTPRATTWFQARPRWVARSRG